MDGPGVAVEGGSKDQGWLWRVKLETIIWIIGELLPMNAPVPQGDEVKLELCSAAPPWKARSSEILKNQHTSKSERAKRLL